MLLKDEVGMLQRVPLFSGIEPAKLKLLAFTS
ncbi:cyclic nucleotide-binding protein, partial [Mesorhizobium sp. M7A.F.Ca.ET.027.03.2.1]